MADDLVPNGAVGGGIVALVTAIAGALGFSTRLSSVETTTKELKASDEARKRELEELSDHVDDEVKSLREEVNALKRRADLSDADIKAMIRAEWSRIDALVRAEIARLDEKFGGIRERVAAIDALVRGIKAVDEINDRRSRH